MNWTPEALKSFENLTSKIAAELVFAQPGKDEGLIPVYSLLNELNESFPEVPVLTEALDGLLAILGTHLDEARPFDRPLLDRLGAFTIWVDNAFTAFSAGQTPPSFEPVSTPASAAADSEEAEPAPGGDSAEEPFREFDCLLQLNLSENSELMPEFYAEAVDHLGQTEAAVLQLEQNPEDTDAINSIFRSFHTIKGVAGFLGLIPINRLSHEVESLLDLVRNGQRSLDGTVIDVVLEAKDVLSQLVSQVGLAIQDGIEPSEIVPVSGLMRRVVLAAASTPAPADSAPETTLPPTPPPETAAGPEATETPSTAPVVPFPQSAAAATPPPATPPATAAASSARGPENTTIRVNTVKLDNLMDMVGELVIVQSQLLESTKQNTGADSVLQRNLSQLTRITKELQHTAMALRMIPVKPTFQKMGRLVRDLGAASGKQVQFTVQGEDTELDRNVVEAIGDPLVHMVRNSMDHGLETTEERTATGKPATGTVELRAYHQGSNIVIELSDDGRGLNADKILAKARERGLVKEGQSFTPEEIFKFIFLPGFSTAEKVTDISGRGVGMDVVRRNIESLRGKIEITSELGKGSVFKILLPLTMAIVDGLIVKVGKDRFILPTTSVKVALRPKRENLATVQGHNEVLNLRGSTIPLFRLHRHFAIETDVTDPLEGTVVVLESASRPYGLLVDEMVSKQEVVIKNLGSLMNGLPGIAGGAILGDGTIALILDPSSLIRVA